MDGEGLDPNSDFPPPQCASGVNDGVDRISELPDEVLFLILSLLPVKKAASTTVLSSRWLNLWKEIPNLKYDRISQLPDEILIVILSFLSLKRAASTSVLSSRWSHLWKHSPYLDFDPYDVDVDHQIWNAKMFEVINSVIQSHKALSLKQFRICLEVDKSSKSAFTKWLKFVFSRQVESLELDFSFVDKSNMVVLEESLREMSIIFGAPQTLFFCQSLKRLCLYCLKVGGQDVELFLHNCPLLEELSILDAALMSDINVCGAKLKLKHLAIRGYGYEGAKTVRVYAPNLSSFMFSDAVGKLVLEYAPELVEVDLISLSSEFVVQHIALICQLQNLKLIFYHGEVRTTSDITNVATTSDLLLLHSYDSLLLLQHLFTGMFPHMPNLKTLSISFESVINRSFLRLTDLIWASPRLEEFELRLFDAVNDPSELMGDMTNAERSPHQHLKVVKFEMYRVAFRDNCVELATYISDNCVALREIVIRHRVEDEPVRDYLEQQLQGKIRRQIQLRFCHGRGYY